MSAALPPFAELQAAPGWKQVDFISDLHLQPGQPETVAAWRRYLAATPADAVFILGDLFEAWIGDDSAEHPGFDAECAQTMADAARCRPLFFMQGNRDFLLGERLLGRRGIRLLDDPTVLTFAGQRWLLTHGDALCVDDAGYQRFRTEVRDPRWQAAFLAKPLPERQAIAQGLRQRSESAKAEQPGYTDIHLPTAQAWLDAAGATALIHGHTHQPADESLPGGRRRHVLSDWDATARPARLEALRLSTDGPARRVPAG